MPRANHSTRDAVSIDTYLQFLLLGIGAGAIYAAIALGLLLTYRSSGVINFAHGAAAMYSAYVFVGLRVDGDLLLPLPGAAGRIHLHTLPTAAAATVAIVATTLLELGVYFAVFRPLRDAPALSRRRCSSWPSITWFFARSAPRRRCPACSRRWE